MFKKEIEYIIDDYSSEMNQAMVNATKDEIKIDLSDKLINIGIIEKSFMYKYYTTVKVILNMYKHNNDKSLNIYDTLKEYISKNVPVSGGYYESMNDSYYGEFDNESFNRSVGYQLDKINDKLNEDSNYSEYYKITNQILDKYDIDKWYPLEKDKNKSFSIDNINPETLKITIKIHDKKTLKVEFRSLSLEEFNNFLHNYELFTESRKKK